MRYALLTFGLLNAVLYTGLMPLWEGFESGPPPWLNYGGVMQSQAILNHIHGDLQPASDRLTGRPLISVGGQREHGYTTATRSSGP